MHPLKIAIDIAGGQSQLARKINEWRESKGFKSKLKQQHIWKWLNHPSGSPVVPPEYCVPIQEITGVECHKLRPDIFMDAFSYQASKNKTEKIEVVYT